MRARSNSSRKAQAPLGNNSPPKNRRFNLELLAKQKFPEEKQRVVVALQTIISQYPQASKGELAARTFGLVEEWRKEKGLVSSLGPHLISVAPIYKLINEFIKKGIIEEK